MESPPPSTPFCDEPLEEFEPFFRYVYPRMMARAVRRLRNQADAEQVVTQVWVDYGQTFGFGQALPASVRPVREGWLMDQTGARCTEELYCSCRQREKSDTDFDPPDDHGGNAC